MVQWQKQRIRELGKGLALNGVAFFSPVSNMNMALGTFSTGFPP